MNEYDRLVEQLTRLEDSEFVSVLERARRNRIAHRPPPPEPPRVFDRDQLAGWYTAKHLSVEPSISDIIYLPGNAPENEIRLLEVNVLSDLPDDVPVEPIEFRVDQHLPGEHRLFVADISPGQWEKIKVGQLALPPGWVLAGYRGVSRKR